MQRHGREQGLPEDGVESSDEIGDPGGHKLSQRPLDRDVIVDVEPGQRLAEQQGKEENHHPATRRVVAGLALRLMTERPGEVSCGVSRRNQKAGEARRFAAEDAPQQTEEQQHEQRVADQRVPIHPVEPPGDIGRCDQRHDQPVKETRRRVPDQDLARDVARLCHRHRSSLEIRQTPRSRPQESRTASAAARIIALCAKRRPPDGQILHQTPPRAPICMLSNHRGVKLCWENY